ncbi:MAG: ATP-binding protein, partial [Infirmifilum sp.]
MRRVRLGFANINVEFADRDLALELIDEWARRGTGFPKVVYGPEGCGKTAWLRQSVELLRDYGFEVVYVNPLNKVAIAEIGIAGLREEFLKLVKEAISQSAIARIAWIAYSIVTDLIKLTRGKVAILVDDAFQVIGIRESAMYVKALLNLIEYPPEHYERIVTIAATSEGVSLREIGRHSWSDTMPIWNMGREGFRQLYEQLPGNKPDFEEAWRLTGGNPRMLERLYGRGWDVDGVIDDIIREKGLYRDFVRKWWDHLREAVDDP